MHADELKGCLEFIREAEKLKDVLRSAYTSTGKHESTAEHTWRLCLMAMVFEDEFGAIDMAKLLKICIIHDLGEAISGDIPATMQAEVPNKSERERSDLILLMQTLPQRMQLEFLALWEEYEYATSDEARLVKGLDKLETIIQHNQGKNPSDFDYAYNLEYGKKHMGIHPLIQQIRALVDDETRSNACKSRAV